ncbi:MAG: hypothetical protein ACK4HQ_07955 [Brevinematales bacterium]
MKKLAIVPISLFSIVMGLMGGAMVTRYLGSFSSVFPLLANLWFCLGIIVFGFVGGVYLLKVIFAFEGVKKKITHPVEISFFATFPIAMILVAQGLRSLVPAFGEKLFVLRLFLLPTSLSGYYFCLDKTNLL